MSRKFYLVFVALILHFMPSDQITHDVAQLEKHFLDFHPDIDWVPWEETSNITAASFKKLCDQILPHLVNDTTVNYTYEPISDADLRDNRTADNTLLVLENTEDVGHVPVFKCVYKEITFYLTHADDDEVYELKCESDEQEIYSLKSGPYKVRYDV